MLQLQEIIPLTHTLNSEYKYMIIHKQNNITFDGNFGIWSYRISGLAFTSTQSSLKLLRKEDMTINSMSDSIMIIIRSSQSVLSNLILLLKAHLMLSSLGGLYGFETNSRKSFIGANVAYSVSNKRLNYHKYLISLKQKYWTQYIQYAFEGDNMNISLIADNKINKVVTVSIYSEKNSKSLMFLLLVNI